MLRLIVFLLTKHILGFKMLPAKSMYTISSCKQHTSIESENAAKNTTRIIVNDCAMLPKRDIPKNRPIWNPPHV